MNATHEEVSNATKSEIGECSSIESVVLPLNGISLTGELVIPVGARGIVLYMLSSGCSRETSRNRLIVRQLEACGIGSLLFSLLTPSEAGKDAHTGYWSFDLELLTHRLLLATQWVMQDPRTRDLGLGFLGTSTGAAAALVAAAQLGYAVQAVISRGGRPDFAGDSLPRVTAPTLFIVGERDTGVLDLNRNAYERLVCRKQLTVVPEASHLFEEPGALEHVATLAADWFRTHLKPIERT